MSVRLSVIVFSTYYSQALPSSFVSVILGGGYKEEEEEEAKRWFDN